MKKIKFKLGDFILIPINNEYKIKLISNDIKDNNTITLNEVLSFKDKTSIFKWFPTKNEKCFFIDIMDNYLKSSFLKLEEGAINNYSFISNDILKVENYCPCCREKEEFIEINQFDFIEPDLGQEKPYFFQESFYEI